MDGVRIFYRDVKDYYRIIKQLNSPKRTIDTLTRKEIELYHQMPKDIIKLAPTLIMSTLPFAFYVLLPLVYFFPRQMLTNHFWNLQQKADFNVLILKKRLKHNRAVFRHLQLHLPWLEGHPLHKKWCKILGDLGSGVQPDVQLIIDCKDLFNEKPYHLNSLSMNHIVRIFVIIED